MQCKNCGAIINQGDTFCRTCAVPVNVDPNTGVENVYNPATNAFMRQGPIDQIQVEPSYQNAEFQPVAPPKNVEPAEDANKKFVERDGNNRTMATVWNFVTFGILILILAIIGYFLYDKVFRNFF